MLLALVTFSALVVNGNGEPVAGVFVAPAERMVIVLERAGPAPLTAAARQFDAWLDGACLNPP